MTVKKEQKVFVVTTLTPDDNALILSGSRLAAVFNKELCLLYHLRKKEKGNQDNIHQKLRKQLLSLEQLPIKTSVLLSGEAINHLPEILADDHEAIIIIARSADYKKYSLAVTRSPIPFLFINPASPRSSFQKVVMPLDLRKEHSDTALWCSWFGRYANSEIVIVAANEKDNSSQRLVDQNVILAKKLFHKSGVVHKIYKGRKSSFNNIYEGLSFAINSGSDLIVILGSSVITPLDWLIGLPERKIISKSGYMPVLIVNPRRDNYILCG